MGLFKPTYRDRASGRLKKTGKYYGQYVDATGKTKRVPLSTDKVAAGMMLSTLVRRAEMARAGVIDKFEEFRTQPVATHVEEWHKNLLSSGVTPNHATLVKTRAKAVLDEAKVVFTSDLVPSKILDAIDALAQANGFSLQTRNFYLQGVKQFCRWLVRDHRIESSPLTHLQAWNVALDRRHDRRVLSMDEVRVLLSSTLAGPVRTRLTGVQRYWLYRLAVSTGLRANELSSLSPKSFDINERLVAIMAGQAKNRREDSLPLPDHLFPELSDWLAGLDPDAPLWPGPWAKNRQAGQFLKGDLLRARNAWIDEAAGSERQEREDSDFLRWEDSEGQFADFHALRHTFITWLVDSGANIKSIQRLARHSTITLTMDRYAKVGAFTLAGVANGVANPMAIEKKKKGTGTLGRADLSCTKLVRTDDVLGNSVMLTDIDSGKTHPTPMGVKPMKTPTKQAEREGFEPSEGLHLHRFSRPARSAALSPLRKPSLSGCWATTARDGRQRTFKPGARRRHDRIRGAVARSQEGLSR